jgi:serine/threonine protein phosphatase PrpC
VRQEAPSCTYVSALVTTDVVVVAWLGDCRAYWLAQTGSTLLTTDDSWATEMVVSGTMSAEDAHADKRAHMITRWLGADAGDIEPHLTTFIPPGPDE